jgi:hypothetical protein
VPSLSPSRAPIYPTVMPSLASRSELEFNITQVFVFDSIAFLYKIMLVNIFAEQLSSLAADRRKQIRFTR